ncbi:transcriptional regulator, partial [Shigella flexneri]
MSDDRFYFSLGQGVKFYPASRRITTSTGNVINLSENGYRFLLLLLQGESDKQ